jgi:sulfur dioxygenase
VQVRTPLPVHCVVPGVQTPVQAPDTQAAFEHACAADHVPVASHVCTASPEHRVEPGTHAPVHAPMTHAYGQALPVSQAPLALHVWTPSPAHWVVPGEHAPTHAPETHACVVQGTGVPQLPDSHDCTPLPEHSVALPEHGPEHWPAVHAWLAHATAADHCPFAAQVCTPSFEHCVVPGMHTPLQAPPTQAWLAQGVALPQAPLALHVCTPVPEHWVEAGAHTPVHPPSTQAWAPQSIGALHCPEALQSWTPLPEHCVAPGEHTGPAGGPRLPSSPPPSFVLASATVASPNGPVDPSLPPCVSSPPELDLPQAANTIPVNTRTERRRRAVPLFMQSPPGIELFASSPTLTVPRNRRGSQSRRAVSGRRAPPRGFPAAPIRPHPRPGLAYSPDQPWPPSFRTSQGRRSDSGLIARAPRRCRRGGDGSGDCNPAPAANEDSSVIHRQLFDQISSTYTYLLADERTREAVIIDPVFEEHLRDAALIRELGLTLVCTLDTHCHADHVTGSWLMKRAFGARVGLSREYGAKNVDLELGHGEVIRLGGRSLEVRATPGHTEGCLSFVTDDRAMVFTGDALLVRGAGRTDFQHGDARRLFGSIRDQLMSLPDECVVLPAHDYEGRTTSTIGEERRYNPRIGGGAREEDFVGYMTNLGLPHPKKLSIAVPANLRSGEPADGEAPVVPDWAPVVTTYAGLSEIAAEWVARNRDAVNVLDVRSPAEFDGELGHLRGAQLIPLEELRARASEVSADKPVVVVCQTGKRSGLATVILGKAGFTRTANVAGGMVRWRQLGLPS